MKHHAVSFENSPFKDVLSTKELKEFYSIWPEKAPLLMPPPKNVRNLMRNEKANDLNAKRYKRRVWENIDCQKYLIEQAQLCAQYGLKLLQNLNLGCVGQNKTYYLENPHGGRYRNLGFVHFHIPVYLSKPKISENSQICQSIAIERITLHPSIRRLGFLNKLAKEMALLGIEELTIRKIINTPFAYHLYLKTLISDGVFKLISSPETIAFDVDYTPCPSFSWNIKTLII